VAMLRDLHVFCHHATAKAWVDHVLAEIAPDIEPVDMGKWAVFRNDIGTALTQPLVGNIETKHRGYETT
jgi:hypothetical protein